MDFRSDNVTGVAPEIMAAVVAASEGSVSSYGADEITERLTRRFADLFEHEVAVFPVATGTAANALALSAITPPWGVIYCHRLAHIEIDECGAPEFYCGGARVATLDGPDGKLQADELKRALALSGQGSVHHMQPASVSLTQASEAGTLYRPAEIAAIAEVVRDHHLSGLHMDGSRFANAVVALGCHPADITWRAGVDVLSFGATKNGALGVEAVIFFDPAKAADFAFRRKRGGHLFSKMRFLSAQLEAYLQNGLWLKNAAHANAMAARLARGLNQIPEIRLVHPVEANELFVELPESVLQGLERDGYRFYRRAGEKPSIRLVTAFNTKESDIDGFVASTRQHAGT